MNKLLSISLALILAGGFLMAENTKAEAMNDEAAFVAGAILLGPPFIWAMTHGPNFGPPPFYGGASYGYPYPGRTRVIYRAPRYGGYYGRYRGRGYGYGYERGWRGHRGHREYRRDRDDARGRYPGRYNRYDN